MSIFPFVKAESDYSFLQLFVRVIVIKVYLFFLASSSIM